MYVTLTSVGNPDHGEDPRTPVSPPAVAEVADLQAASIRCRAYIEQFHLGGGNWTGGDVFADGQLIAKVSYNGRVWDPDGVEIRLDKHI